MIRTTLLLIGLSVSPQVAGDTAASVRVREALPVPAESLLPQMLRQAERGHWQPLGRAIDVVRPLVDHIDGRAGRSLGPSLDEAVARRESSAVVDLIAIAVIEGVVLLVEDATAVEDQGDRRKMIRTAFAEALILAPRVRQEEFRLWGEIEQQFRNANRLAGRPTEFEKTCGELVELLRRTLPEED